MSLIPARVTGNLKIRSLNIVKTPIAGGFNAKTRRPLVLATLLLAGLLAGPTSALADDRDQPIHIESDRAERDGRQGITIYEGDVRLRQGSMRIHADRLTVHTDGNNQVQEVLAEGRPAQFEQRPSADDEPIQAEAFSIRYQVTAEQLELTTNAWLEQGSATLRGNRIDYDMARELMRAEGEPDTERPRIEMVIPPRSQRPQQD